MSDIGKPDEHYPGKLSVRSNSGINGGFIEERICKVEHEAKTLIEQTTFHFCLACDTPISNKLPASNTFLCSDCLDNLGTLTKTKRKLKFLG